MPWETVYHMLDEDGAAMMAETQRWTLQDEGDRYLLDLQWTDQAATDITIANYFYDSLFARMPWHEGIQIVATKILRQVDKTTGSQQAL